MGVKGLWQLLEPTGKAISPEHLSGKVLAVDVSMWLHQFSKGIRDSEGNPVAKAHLIGLFKRICKLLFYGIKPVFVFDGSVPVLKKQTIARRQQKREQACMDSRRTAKKLLQRLLQKHAIKNFMGIADGAEDLGEVVEKKDRSKRKDEDLFVLPSTEYPLRQEQSLHANGRSEAASDEREYEEGDRDSLLARFGFGEDVDFDSEAFKSLPASLKLEMLLEQKERKRKLNHGDVWRMPKNAEDFSKFQLQRVVDSSKITERIEALRREVAECDEVTGCGSSRIASNDEARFTFRKRRGRNRFPEDAFAKRMCSDRPRTSSSESDVHRSTCSILSEASLTDFYSSEIKNPMDKRFAVVPALTQEMDRKTRSLNFVRWKNKRDDEDDDDDDGKDEEDERRNVGLLKLEKMESEDSEDDGKDFVEVKPLSPIGRTEDVVGLAEPDHAPSQNSGTASDNISTNHEAPLENQFSDSGWTNIKARNSDDEKKSEQPKADGNVVWTGSHSNVGCHNDEHEWVERNESGGILSPSIETETETPKEIVSNSHETTSAATVAADVVGDEVESDRTPAKEVHQVVADDEEEMVEEEEEDDDDELLSEVLEACKDDSEVTLDAVERKLTSEVDRLKAEVGKNERLATSITEQTNHEVRDLLRLFGVPFVVGPAEAEAQCAFLDGSGQTDGTVTNDSDVFLFGARRVVRHLFDGGEVPEMYSSEEIQRKLLLNRNDLICMAMLCGCDYTEGVRGVGPVTATEIIQEFKGHDLDCLIKFRDWWVEAKKLKRPPEKETKVKSQLRRFHLFEGFPNPAVYEAYKNPTVDTSTEPFSWNQPEMELLEEFAIKTLNWSKKQADDMLVPLAKKLKNASSQKQVTDYFNLSSSSLGSLGKKLRSQRVRRVVNVRKTERRKERMMTEEEVKSERVSSKRQKSIETKNCKTSRKESKKRKAVVAKEMNLSEESSVDDDDDDGIDDAILASIDLEEVVHKARNLAK